MEKVLIIDDDPSIHEIFKIIFKYNRVRLLFALSSKEGIKVINNNTDINVAFLDITMPNQSGLDTIQEIKTLCSSIKIILMTGQNIDDISKNIDNIGVNGIIYKPFDADEIKHILQKLHTTTNK